MSDLVQKLVGALEALYAATAGQHNFAHALELTRAALSEAKAGGWVAVPGAVYEDGGVSLIRRGTEDERCRARGSVRLYAPLPAPPAQRGEG